MRYQFKVQGNVFALVQIFNAIPSPSFSAPAELRMINPNHWSLSYVNSSLRPLELPCSIHPRRTTRSDLLEGQQRLEKRCWVFQGGMPHWSQGAAREGEAASIASVGRGKSVPPPRRFWKAKSSMSLRHFPVPLLQFYFPSLWDKAKN
jgi:hypothetical protein